MASDHEDEPTAMLTIAKTLAALPTDDARRRVIAWASDKFGLLTAARPAGALPPTGGAAVAGGSQSFETFADLFDALAPTSDKERALAAAYWRTHVEAQPTFQSQELNSMLKDLGHRVSNITDALSGSMEEKPALILQMKKAGSTRQARKTYKLSTAGMRWAEARIQGGSTDEKA